MLLPNRALLLFVASQGAAALLLPVRALLLFVASLGTAAFLRRSEVNAHEYILKSAPRRSVLYARAGIKSWAAFAGAYKTL